METPYLGGQGWGPEGPIAASNFCMAAHCMGQLARLGKVRSGMFLAITGLLIARCQGSLEHSLKTITSNFGVREAFLPFLTPSLHLLTLANSFNLLCPLFSHLQNEDIDIYILI